MNKKTLTARPTSIVMILAVLLLTFFLMPVSGAGGSGIAYGDVIDKSDSFYVADDANVISAETENHIVDKNAELEALCGGQIVVATVDFLDGMDIEDYAYKLFDDWDIGDKDKNNGVLLLLAIGEENYWCMQGKGLENTLTSGDIDDILWDYLEEDFAAGDYDAGVRSVFDALYTQVSAIYGGTASQTGSNDGSGGGSSFGSLLLTCFIIFVVLMVILFLVATLKKRSGRTSYRDAGGHDGYDGYDGYDGDVSPARPERTRRRRRTVFIPVGRSRRPRSPHSDDDWSGGGLFGGPSTFGRPSGGGNSHSPFGGGFGHGGGGGSRGGGAGRRH